jgi:hypothetical protein
MPCAEPAGQPEPVATILVGDDDSGDSVTGVDGFVAPAMQQTQQGVFVSSRYLVRYRNN